MTADPLVLALSRALGPDAATHDAAKPRSVARMVAENFAYDLLDVEDRLVAAYLRVEFYRFAYQQAVHRLAAVERDLRTARGTIGALREELRATRRGSAA